MCAVESCRLQVEGSLALWDHVYFEAAYEEARNIYMTVLSLRTARINFIV